MCVCVLAIVFFSSHFFVGNSRFNGSERDIFRYMWSVWLWSGLWKTKTKKKKVREREEIRLAFAVVAITLHGVIFNDNSQTQRPQSGHVCVPVCVLFVYFNNLAMVLAARKLYSLIEFVACVCVFLLEFWGDLVARTLTSSPS